MSKIRFSIIEFTQRLNHKMCLAKWGVAISAKRIGNNPYNIYWIEKGREQLIPIENSIDLIEKLKLFDQEVDEDLEILRNNLDQVKKNKRDLKYLLINLYII